MSRKVWVVAASIAAVEALKDQGFCRWNYTLRSLLHQHQHAKNNIRSSSSSQQQAMSSSTMRLSVPSKNIIAHQKFHKSEESLRTVIKETGTEMSLMRSKVWVVAASIAAVEALKDQGFCRWNYTLRSLLHQHQHAKNNIRSSSSSQQQAMSSSTMRLSVPSKNIIAHQKFHKSEESLRTVMYLSCWAPN
ncbi:hypothetical protein Dimus_006462 [Dionaea muscipula]